MGRTTIFITIRRRINIESESAKAANLFYTHTDLGHHDRLGGNDVT